MPDEFDKEFWEGHYRGHPGAHDGGGPNPSLVTEAGNLPPGRALDAGCGHGADALWLASRGWQVTAVDVSPTALAYARDRARSYGDDVASRIDWAEVELAAWLPPEAYVTAEEVAGLLDPAAWHVGVAETRTRMITGPHGHEVTLRDAVLRARRHP